MCSWEISETLFQFHFYSGKWMCSNDILYTTFIYTFVWVRMHIGGDLQSRSRRENLDGSKKKPQSLSFFCEAAASKSLN